MYPQIWSSHFITVSIVQESILHLEYLNDLLSGVVSIFISFPLQFLFYTANSIFFFQSEYTPSLAYNTHTQLHTPVKSLQWYFFISGQRWNKTIFYSYIHITNLMYYHISLQALCSIQYSFLLIPHYFPYGHNSSFTSAISSALNNFLFLHKFKVQLNYHFFMQCPWVGQILYYIFIIPSASLSMYFLESSFYTYFWNFLVNTIKICKLQQSKDHISFCIP